MDAELKAMLRMSTVVVRRVTSIAAGGGETLGTAVELTAYVEHARANVDNGAAGGTSPGTARQTRSLLVFDAADVAESPLLELQEDDRFWIDGTDDEDPLFSRRPDRFFKAMDPDTGEISHFEVSL